MKRKKTWSFNDANKLVREGIEQFGCMNQVLYGMCSAWPTHLDQSQVTAKVWIIGRTYQTGIERITKWEQDGIKPLNRVARTLCENASDVDRIIRPVRELPDSALTPESVSAAVLAHSSLCEILRAAGGSESLKKSPRSFASKYLHFHAPSVPIYDAIVSRVIGHSEWPWHGAELPLIGDEEKADPLYLKYCTKLLQMAERWPKGPQNPLPTARNLDTYLLAWN